MDRGLGDRLFKFAIDVINFVNEIRNSTASKIIRYQLIKSSTSSGANYEESQAAASKADFKNKIKVALKEMRESNYWLRILKELRMGEKGKGNYLILESEELKKILGKICARIS